MPGPPVAATKQLSLPATVKKGRPAFFEILGDSFFVGGMRWLGFGCPAITESIGTTLYQRVMPTDDMSRMCGKEPLYLTHSDELWEPVKLRSIYKDGTVDCESTRLGWQLRQKVFNIGYDPVKKMELFMPRLFTSEQLSIWRKARWDSVAFAE
jgi:hypothetical protein